jgi:mono/diheme cytochrome c family protein
MSKLVSSLVSLSKLVGVKRRGLRLAPLFLVLGGCGSVENAAPIVISGGGAHAATLQSGRAIYTRQCTACHSAEPIRKYSGAEWNTILPDMAQRTKLTSDQAAAVSAYVAAVLEMPAPAPR